MDIESIFTLPIYFIKENLNGWVLMVLIAIIIYFIILRNYYVKREQFNQDLGNPKVKTRELEGLKPSQQDLENPARKRQDLENPARKRQDLENPARKSSRINNNNDDDSDDDEDRENDEIDDGENDDDGDDGENGDSLEITPSYKGARGAEALAMVPSVEGFESPTTTNYASVSNTNTNTNTNSSTNTISDATTENTIIMNTTIAKISTTLFDNIKLNSTQIDLCKSNYNQVINKYILDLKKLNKLKKNNEYLNAKKQVDIIIADGIDNIINYLSNTIKSPLVLTRSSIKKDVLNILSFTLENLIDKINVNLSKYVTTLANMDSTTIDYNTMMKNIDISREQIEEYVEIEKIITSSSSNLDNSKTGVNKILNKSAILPIYEKNFDRINQLINSDFNSNETELANKYGQAYTEYLNEKKKDELDINPLRLASKIESGIVNMISNLSSNANYNNKNKNKNNNNHDIIEQINPIPDQDYKLISNTNLNKNANIYNDRGNLGTYLVDKKTQSKVLEGFKNIKPHKNIIEGYESTTPTTTQTGGNESIATPTTTKGALGKNKKEKEKDFFSKLLSGDFIQYIMDNISDKMTSIYGLYDDKYGSGQSNDKESKFNLEENMIPMGFLFFVLSMLIYFVDTTS
jgi:hypothetical protein